MQTYCFSVRKQHWMTSTIDFDMTECLQDWLVLPYTRTGAYLY